METTQNSNPSTPSGFAQRAQHSKALVAIIAVLGVTVLAMGAALVTNRSDAQARADAPSTPTLAAAAPTTAVRAPANLAPATAVAPMAAPAVAHAGPPPQAPAHSPYPTVAGADVCTTCGTVEAVSAVQREGKVNGVAVGNTTIGLGAVAGGVLGGVLGHQVGGGSGKTAMSLLGAAGGAYAGNAVEKNMNKVTVYAVRVRMDNGSERRLEMSSSVPVGARVVVEGKNLRLANGRG